MAMKPNHPILHIMQCMRNYKEYYLLRMLLHYDQYLIQDQKHFVINAYGKFLISNAGGGGGESPESIYKKGIAVDLEQRKLLMINNAAEKEKSSSSSSDYRIRIQKPIWDNTILILY
jgi:hypothetical protein